MRLSRAFLALILEVATIFRLLNRLSNLLSSKINMSIVDPVPNPRTMPFSKYLIAAFASRDFCLS